MGALLIGVMCKAVLVSNEQDFGLHNNGSDNGLAPNRRPVFNSTKHGLNAMG